MIALVIANTLNAGADIGAIGATINLPVPIPSVVFIVPVSLGIIGLQARPAEALPPLGDDASALLLAVGLIGAGVLTVPVLTGSAA